MNFFPTLYPDELLYSGCARYAQRSGNNKEIYNIVDLLGTRNAIAAVELPSKIDALIENMPVGNSYTPQYIIMDHTLLAYFSAFTTEKRMIEAYQSMCSEKGSIPYSKLGINSSGVTNLNQKLRFCPECMKSDYLQYGEPYWHRLHQIACVHLCPEHECLTYDSTVLIRGGNRQAFIYASVDNCRIEKDIVYDSVMQKKLIWMAQDIQQLLSLKHNYRNPEWYRNIFRDALAARGYARQNNYIHQKELLNDFVEYYGKEYLDMMQSMIYDRTHNWLSSMVRNTSYTTYTYRYLLLARFLDISIDSLFEDKGNSTKDYQQLWDERLKELINQNLSIRELSLILGTSTKTIRKRVDELGINKFWIDNGGGKYRYVNYVDTDVFKEKRKECRQRWISYLQRFPDKSSNEIRKIDPVIYRWLTKYDIEWLRNNLRKKECRTIIDWNKRDKELLPKVKAIAFGMQAGKPTMISWGSIGGKLGISGWLIKYKDKLPQTMEYILTVTETLHEFQIRKIIWAITELEKDSIAVTKWNLLEKAGVKSKYIPSIRTELCKLLDDKGYGSLIDQL